LRNSIVAGNSGYDYWSVYADDIHGSVAVSNGRNIIGTIDGVDPFGDLTNVDPAKVFASVHDFGGGGDLVLVNGTCVAPLRDAVDNPALAGADPATAGATDQRGAVRPAPDGTAPDVGAYELTQKAHISNTPTAGDDHLLGTTGNDVIDALAGNDHIRGIAGNDVLSGNTGNDVVLGGAGNDRLDGGVDADTASYATVAAAVTVNLAAGTATGEGSDTLVSVENATGGTGADTLTGDGGANLLAGGGGADSLVGAAGADTLEGGAGIDTLAGGADGDLYRLADATDQVQELAGGGDDTIEAGFTFSLALLAEVEGLTLAGAAAIDGTGNTLANTITGNAAANTLAGAEGNDTLSGGEGNDRLDGGTGADAMDGGLGDDTYVVDAAGDTVSEGPGGGIDAVEASVTHTLAAEVENLLLTGGATINGTGNALNNVLTGNGGANVLSGGGGTDSLSGAGGADTLNGDGASDTLAGGGGADLLQGGAGNDVYVIDALDSIVDTAGIDRVQAGFTYTLASLDLENLTLTGAAAIDGTGNANANNLQGNTGANVLLGLDGADTLTGGAGNDTLVGGLGADRLVPGVGLDTIRYAFAAEGGDTIVSYRGVDDTIEVSAAGFGGGLTAGVNVVTTGRYVANATGLADSAVGVGQFVFETDTALLRWDADGTGVGAAVVVANLTGATAWAGTEIVVIA
jgi:Ca2+-binding RTX toxin-like protein